MAETASQKTLLGTVAPHFRLLDTCSQKQVSLQELKSDIATVIMFVCNHCPYVKHILPKLVEVSEEYQKKGVQFIAISSNDVENYPLDGPKQMKELAVQKNFSFPYLYDETQTIAKAYKAACTPEFYILDKELRMVYHGRFDHSTPSSSYPVTGKDLTQTLDAILAGNKISDEQLPSLGCNIKWKKKETIS